MQLRRDRNHLRAAGLEVVLIGLGAVAKTREFKEQFELPFAVLSDPDRRAYQLYGLLRLNPFREARPQTARDLVRDTREVGGKVMSLGQDFMQLGGTFVIDTQGILRFTQRALRIADRPDTEALIRAMQG